MPQTSRIIVRHVTALCPEPLFAACVVRAVDTMIPAKAMR